MEAVEGEEKVGGSWEKAEQGEGRVEAWWNHGWGGPGGEARIWLLGQLPTPAPGPCGSMLSPSRPFEAAQCPVARFSYFLPFEGCSLGQPAWLLLCRLGLC